MSSQILKYPRNLSGTYRHVHDLNATQKMKFSIRNFFCKCNQICRFQRIWSHLLKKSFTENFIFCIVKCSWDFHMTLGISSEYTVNFLISLSAYCKNVVHAQALLSLRIQFECGKIRTRKTPYLDTFHAVRRKKITIYNRQNRSSHRRCSIGKLFLKF